MGVKMQKSEFNDAAENRAERGVGGPPYGTVLYGLPTPARSSLAR